MQFTPLTDSLAAQAGQLFARGYQRKLRANPKLTPQLNLSGTSNAHHISSKLSEWADAGASVIAHQDGIVQGFLVGRFINFFHASNAFYVPEWGGAIVADDPDRLIAHMYAWLTRSGQLDRSTVHTVSLFANDQPAIAAWSSLGFGAHLIDAARTTRSSDANNDQIRAATPADLPALSILNQKVSDHLSQPPVHLPPDDSPFEEAKLPGPTSYTSVAEVDRQVVGYMSCQFGAQEAMTLRNDAIPHIHGAYLEPAHRGGTLAKDMLDDLLAWARTKSASHITTDFETANVEGANFWLGKGGFQPVLTGLVRRLPSRY